MKKVYLILIMIVTMLSVSISTTYATLTISNQSISSVPPFTMQGNNIFCIQKGQPIGGNNITPGDITYTEPNKMSQVYNVPQYSTVGTYDLPIEIAYALTSGASLEEMQYAIWHSSMNEGNTLKGDPNDTELADLPQYNQILQVEDEKTKLEDAMEEYIVKKDKINKTIAEIKMQNTNIQGVLEKIKIQSENWSKAPDVSYIQKTYEENLNEIKKLEENNGDSSQIEKLKQANEKIKQVIDSKSYSAYIDFLENCLKENENAIKQLESILLEYESFLTNYENSIKEYKNQIESLKNTLGEEYSKLYENASSLLHDGKIYKDFYEKLQNAGGYKPTFSKDNTKLVKLSNNTYKAGPFKLNYIEGKTDSVNFSYIQNMYLKDQDGDVIEDIEIINCNEFNGEYPASGETFYIKFTAREKDILEDENISTSTWREGRYRYTETTIQKTYSVKLIVDFRYLEDCTGKYSRIEGQGDIINWNEITDNQDGEDITYWVAQKSGKYSAQTLIAVDSNTEEIPESINTPRREWRDYVLEVYATGRDEDTDIDKQYRKRKSAEAAAEVGGGRWWRWI